MLTAIGGAFPFLHIYEARRGHVLVRRLVDSCFQLISLSVAKDLREPLSTPTATMTVPSSTPRHDVGAPPRRGSRHRRVPDDRH